MESGSGWIFRRLSSRPSSTVRKEHGQHLPGSKVRSGQGSRRRRDPPGGVRPVGVTSHSERLAFSSWASGSEESAQMQRSTTPLFREDNSVFLQGATSGDTGVAASPGFGQLERRGRARKCLGFHSGKRRRSSLAENCPPPQGKRLRMPADLLACRVEQCKCSLAGLHLTKPRDGKKGSSRPPLAPLPSQWQQNPPTRSADQRRVTTCPTCSVTTGLLGEEENDENTPPLHSNIPESQAPPPKRKWIGHAHSGHALSINSYYKVTKTSSDVAFDSHKERSHVRDNAFARDLDVAPLPFVPVDTVDLETLDVPTPSPMEIEPVRRGISCVEDHSLSVSDLGITDLPLSIQSNEMSIDNEATSFGIAESECSSMKIPQPLELLPPVPGDASESESNACAMSSLQTSSSSYADLEPVESFTCMNFASGVGKEQILSVLPVDVESAQPPTDAGAALGAESAECRAISVDYKSLSHVSIELGRPRTSEASSLRGVGPATLLGSTSPTGQVLATSLSPPLGQRTSGSFHRAISRLRAEDSPVSVHACFPDFLRSDLHNLSDSDSPMLFATDGRPQFHRRPSPLTFDAAARDSRATRRLSRRSNSFPSDSSSPTPFEGDPVTRFDFSNVSSDSSSSSPMFHMELLVGRMAFSSQDTPSPEHQRSLSEDRKRKRGAKPSPLTLASPMEVEGEEGDPLTPNTLRIQVAVDTFQLWGNVVGDASKRHTLPTVPGPSTSVTYITVEVMRDLLEGKYADTVPSFEILDCRFSFEYAGGHIKGAVNVSEQEKLLALYEERARSGLDCSRHVLVFHCEYSSVRGPNMCRLLRGHDRKRNAEHYPRLLFPEIYVLKGGYKHFFKVFPDLCEPQGYIPMWEDKYKEELCHFKAKSRTWPSPKSAHSGSETPPTPHRPSTSPPEPSQGLFEGFGQHLDSS